MSYKEMKNIFMNNLWFKIVSIILAVLLWLYISDMISKEMTFRVPLEINLSDKMVPINNIAEYINITVRGPSGVINSLTPKSFRITKDLSDVFQSGNIIVPAQDLIVSMPEHVSIEKFFPRRITINLDRVIQKEFKVNVITKGKPAAGYMEFKGHTANPATIVLKAPAQLVLNINTVSTEPIDISGLVSTRIFSDVKLQEFLPRFPLNKDKHVDVTVTIGEETSVRLFPKIPIRLLEMVKTPFNIKMSSHETDVHLKGKKEILDTIGPSDFKIFVDISNLEPGEYDLIVEGRLSEELLSKGVSFDVIDPSKVVVTISVKQPSN